jgi:hypothetical protein
MRPYEVPAELLESPFTVADALKLGVPHDVLRGSGFRQIHRGVHVSAKLDDSTQLRAAAARLLLPASAVFSHGTAVDLFGLPRAVGDGRLHVTVPPGGPRPRLKGVVAHARVLGDDATAVRGLPVTTFVRTFFDLAPSTGLVGLVVLADAAVRRGLTTPNGLVERAVGYRGLGCGLARVAAGLTVSKVDSPMETRGRILFVLGGLPMPEVNVDIFDDQGGWVARVDMLYRGARLVIEYWSSSIRGDQHRTDKHQWRDDIATHRLLRNLGWTVEVLTYADLRLRPLQTLWVVHRHLIEAGYPGVPAKPADWWVRHWPGVG